jgi:hypothetical protein
MDFAARECASTADDGRIPPPVLHTILSASAGLYSTRVRLAESEEEDTLISISDEEDAVTLI